ncbi:MAG: YhgE/Pip family protein, partial [Staphylococcus simulans]|nr:YhgE/Pip family protein [Staphylococcus simulans]
MFNELKFIKNNKMLIVALIAIGLLPLIYVALFVGSIWNPYDKTDQLKISIVNEDKAATLQGKKINIGDEVVSKLKDNKKFDFQEVSKDTAKKQLKNG